MEFTALPSQGAGKIPDIQDKRNESGGDFEAVLEKALKESGMIQGLPSFASIEQSFPMSDAPVRRAEDDVESTARSESRSASSEKVRSSREDGDWRELKGVERAERRDESANTEHESQQRSKESGASISPVAPGMASAVDAKDTIEIKSTQQPLESVSIKQESSKGPRSPAQIRPADLPKAILKIVSSLREGGEKIYRATLKLNPEKLGSLDIELSLEKGRLSVSIHASEEAARETLEAEIQRLREVLEGQGFEEVHVELHFGSRGHHSDSKGEIFESQMLEQDGEASLRKTIVEHGDGIIDLLA